MVWEDADEAVIPLFGGPYDGGEADTDYLLAGRAPEKLGIGRSSPPWRTVGYDLAVGRPCYRFAGWPGHGQARPIPVPLSRPGGRSRRWAPSARGPR